ncbi:hypothetical protein HOLleu_35460 [Holothuria leucospilota]|uniref:Uncharacterized protein n=1 Tax=Holothuria leucospilota TaxID=206669 RepID=A0A9Q0YRD7_HOLLE|nr:hypothetical protein HOLleu_35460 [Holothuria leucospilota]
MLGFYSRILQNLTETSRAHSRAITRTFLVCTVVVNNCSFLEVLPGRCYNWDIM